jgi:DNA-binding ferritin-like protein
MNKSKTFRKKHKSTKRKTIRSQKYKYRINTPQNENKTIIVRVFLEMLNNIKLFHWKTRSYAQHKATDELYENMNEKVDRFIETLLGKDESRIKLLKKRVELLDAKNTHEFKSRIYEYRDFLIDMNDIFDSKKDSDILSIRDDILSDINQFLYLLTFNK